MPADNAPEVVTTTDPIMRLLADMRMLGRACEALSVDSADGDAVQTMDEVLPRYRRYLEEVLLPLLKRRLRVDDDEDEQQLRRDIFLIEAELARLEQDWHARRAPAAATTGPADTAFARRLAGFVDDCKAHLDKMEGTILPAVHARLSACDLGLLGEAMVRPPRHR